MCLASKREGLGSANCCHQLPALVLMKTEPGISQYAQQEGRKQWSQVEAKEIGNKCKKNTSPVRAVKHKSGLPRRLQDLHPQKFRTQADRVPNSVI